MRNTLIIHPIFRALQEESEQLRRKSAKLYLHAEFMQFEERPLLLSLYETHIGKLLLEEYELKVKVRLAILEAQLIQAYINRGSRPDEKEIAARILLEQEKFKFELKQKEAEIKAAQDFLNAPTYTKEETEELRRLYCLIAKSLHPDLHPDQTDRERDLFLKAVAAYRVGDIHVLRQIALTLTDGSDGDLTEDSLQALVNRLRESVKAFQDRIDQMETLFPFIYRKQLQDEVWIKEQQVEISERIAAAKAELESRQNYLMTLKLWKKDSLS